MNRALENIKESMCMYEMKQHKPWFNVGSFMTLNQTKQAKVQCLQHPNQSNVDNLNNVRREASRHDISGGGGGDVF
jgi:hypothetical protein